MTFDKAQRDRLDDFLVDLIEPVPLDPVFEARLVYLSLRAHSPWRLDRIVGAWLAWRSLQLRTSARGGRR